MKLALRDWRTLIKNGSKNPVHVRRLVPRKLDFIGKCDACIYGIGGAWISGPGIKYLIVWKIELPDDITLRLVSLKNINGNISISDLEIEANLM